MIKIGNDLGVIRQFKNDAELENFVIAETVKLLETIEARKKQFGCYGTCDKAIVKNWKGAKRRVKNFWNLTNTKIW